MGYRMFRGDTQFRIKSENKHDAWAATRPLFKESPKMSGYTHTGGVETRHFAWVDMDDFRMAKTIEGVIEAWRWKAVVDEKTGDIVDLSFCGEKLGDDETLWLAIAPFVEDGSYIQMTGEDGCGWRWCFDEGRLSKKTPLWG